MHIEYRRAAISEIRTQGPNGEPVVHDAITSGRCVIVDEGRTYAYLRCIAHEDNPGELLGTSLAEIPQAYQGHFVRTRVRRPVQTEDGQTVEVDMLVKSPEPDDIIIEENVEPIKFAGEQ